MRVDILQADKMIKLGRFCSIRGSEESQMLVILVHNRGEEKLLRKYGGIRWASAANSVDKDSSIFSFCSAVMEKKRGC